MPLDHEISCDNWAEVLRAFGHDPSEWEAFLAHRNGREPQAASPLLTEAIALYIKSKPELSLLTVRNYSRVLENFMEHMRTRWADLSEETWTVDRVKARDVQEFISQAKPDGIRRKATTVNKYRDILSSFFETLVDHETIARNSVKSLTREPEPGSVPVALTTEEQQEILALSRRSQNGLRNHTIINLTLNTGLRAREVCALKWADIDFKQQWLTVVRGKGQKTRRLPLLPSVVNDLTYYRSVRSREIAAPGHSDFVFLNTKGPHWGQAMKVDGLEGIMSPLLRPLGKPKGIKFHVLRHSFAVNLLWAGVHIAVISRLLGHASFQTTNQYLKVGDPALKKALEEAFPEGVLVPRLRRDAVHQKLLDQVREMAYED